MLTGEHARDIDANVLTSIWRYAATRGECPCLTDLDDSAGAHAMTYGDVIGQSAEVAGGLLATGIEPGQRVALLLRNSTEYVIAFLSVVAAGAVVVPLNTRLQADELAHMVKDSGTALLITEDSFVGTCPSLLEIEGLRVHSVSGSGSGLVGLEGAPLPEPLPPPASGLMSLMYTSGTTGLPKAVMLTHRSWAAVSDIATSVLDIVADDSVLHTAPLTHGAGFLLLPALRTGARNLVCRSFDPARTAELIDQGLVTGTFLVPSMIRMLLDAVPSGWTAPESYRWLYYAGSPIEPGTLVEAAAAFDGRVVQSFAQMESPMFVTVLDAADHARAVSEDHGWIARSAGRVLPGVELRIDDAHGLPVPVGEDGEIVVRAPQVMAGYWHREADTRKALADGWLHTGDVGHLDENGYLFVVDRLKDMIITGGSNVYAREIEQVLLAIPGVREAAVIGLPDRMWGEAIAAVLTPEEGPGDSDAVISHCRSALPDYRVPKHVFWLEHLPRNPYGKVLKRQLRDQFSAAEARTSP